MNMLTLDKWIEQKPQPAYYTLIFIDYHGITPYFEEHERSIDFEKFYRYLEDIYGKKITPYLYLGAFDSNYVSSWIKTQQKKFFSEISRAGFIIQKGIKYTKNSRKIAIKGTEVALGIDLFCFSHQNFDTKDCGILFCGERSKYRKVLNKIKKDYNKKIKTFSLAREYENNYENFMEFISTVGITVKGGNSSKNFEKVLPPNHHSELSGIFNSTYVKGYKRHKRAISTEKKPDTIMYIDYGNIHHSLLDLKQHKYQMKTLSEVDFLMLLKRKAEAHHTVKKAVLFMGMPQLKIDELKIIRKKNEALKRQLEKEGFEVHFSYNELLYKGGMKEQGVDLSMGVHIINAALKHRCDKIILVSGDADFVPVVRKLKELKKEVEVWSFTEPEHNSPLSPFLILEMSHHGNVYEQIQSINSLLNC